VGDGEGFAGEGVAGDAIEVSGRVTGVHAADHRHVVGAVDGDGDDLAGSAIARDRGEAVGERLAGTELLDRRLAVVSRIGPRAVGREREGAEAIAAGRAGLRREIGLAGIDVGDGERSAGGDVAGVAIDVLGHAAGALAADYRHVVGAVDGYAYAPACGSIARDGGEAVGERLAGTELLDRRLAVVGRISPRAVGREREGAEAIAAGGAGLPRVN